MAYILNLPTFGDERGELTVVEQQLPFEMKRFYYIYNITAKRGGHRHHKAIQALICLNGSCDIYVNNGEKEETLLLDTPSKCLIIEARDWHTMDNFSKGSTLLVFSSEYYDQNDYIDEPYK
jgi:dTDP-4-dehydrorhamnose 3,5-epimerase-like enzyme